MKYSDFRNFSSYQSQSSSYALVFEKNYLDLLQVDLLIEFFDKQLKLKTGRKQFAQENMNQNIQVPVRKCTKFKHQIDKQQCIVNYQKMSSKYSEFRKCVGLQRQDSQSSNNSYTDGINLQQINNMIDFLASPLKLSPKKGYYPGIGKRSPMKGINKSQIKVFSSGKNSQVNQTSDLTTNVDSQSISNHHNEKLPLAPKNLYRRHHTERQSSQKKIDIQDMIDETSSRICFDFDKEQYLLDQNQQKEENQISSAADDLKQLLHQKLSNIQLKLNKKKIGAAQMDSLLQRLNSLQALIDKF